MARHKPVSKQRWSVAQKAELHRLRQLGDIEQLRESAKSRYLPLLAPLTANLADDAQILDVGCGPVCIAQFIETGHKTYLDPLLDDYRRMFPGSLPEGDHLACMAEEIPLPDRRFDLIICFDTLSFTLNPELLLHEVERLLKPDGFFAVAITVWPQLLARFHYLLDRMLPVNELQSRLYRYTQRGIRNTLSRHFRIESACVLPLREGRETGSEDWYFICTRKQTDVAE